MEAIRSIGQYEIVDRLGDGGMGTVYKGRDPRFDRDVAIKLLHPQLARDPEVVARFKSEAIIQAKLNHPNIATVHDFVADGETLAIVMEFIDGETLEQAIAATAGKGLPPERTTRIITQVLSAVGFAHAKGLIHRDLKPSNIMLQRFDEEEIVKVLDFGVAKILGSEKLRTATSAKIGTLAYMSPEHIRSPRNVDARSDLYSIGSVLYECITGALPFDADSEYDLMRAIVDQPPQLGPVPAKWASLLRKALSKSPDDRFQRAKEFRLALRRQTSPSAGERDEPIDSSCVEPTLPGTPPVVNDDCHEAILAVNRAFARRDAAGVARALGSVAKYDAEFSENAIVTMANEWLLRLKPGSIKI